MIVALLLTVPNALHAQTANSAGKPNVLFLFADDMRADTIAAHGNPHIKTPHLDGLVRRGFSFRGNYIFGGNNGAVCVPSRAMLMSGKTWFHLDAPTLKGARLMPEHRARGAAGSPPGLPVAAEPSRAPHGSRPCRRGAW